MKTDEELLKVIHDNEYFLPFESNAYIVRVDKEKDEIEMGLNVMMASPRIGEEGEILKPHYRDVRYGLRFKFKLSDLFQLAGGQEPPIRDINYTMQKLEEALKRIEELQQEAPRCPHFVANDYVHDSETSYRCAAGLCSWSTGKHDEECDIVAGLSQRVKDFEDDYKLVMEERCGDDRLHCTCVPSLRAAIKEAREEVLDLFSAHCPVKLVGQVYCFDTMSSRTYEYTQELLLQWGLLKPEQCLRRKE